MGAVQKPAEVLASLDTTWEWFSDGTRVEGNRTESRHNEGFNALFVDGHVKWQRLSNMLRSQIDETLPAQPW